VGDTYCYFAGMTFAVVAILGHFSKTLLLFFIPQVLNFLWSTPQLFNLVPCPRHRLPRYDSSQGLMFPSTFPCTPKQYRWLKVLMRVNKDASAIPNMTVINLCLQICGPLTERKLCIVLLTFQALCCAFGLICRYYIAGFFFDE
jgi:UDP-N-acetylglucosamine--dolichyl-phosphate N-acetylglucosaminephosphotransferase